MKKDAFYFKHDSNARTDEKLTEVRMNHGWEGYGLYWAIVEKLRESSEYKMTCNYKVIAFDLQTQPEIIRAIVEDYGLFEIEENWFWSSRLCEDLGHWNDIKAKRSAAGKASAESKARAKAERTNQEQESNTCSTPVQHMDNTALTQVQLIEENIKDDNTGKDNKDGDEKKSTVQKAKKFVKPTLEEVAAYCQERNNLVDPQRFLSYYNSNGWKVGRNPMKDWKAAVVSWERNDYGNNSKSTKDIAKSDEFIERS